MNEQNDRSARELNLAFLELYKRVDRFLRDAFTSRGGVSEYIRAMEERGSLGRMYFADWEKDHAMLKRARWIRNRLSHDTGFDAQIVNEIDYAWLDSFLRRLNELTDPLAMVSKRELYRHDGEQRPHKTQPRTGIPIKPAQKTRRTLWQRIKDYWLYD